MENRAEMQRKLDAYLKVRVLFSIILGLGVSRLLSGVAKIVQHPKEYKLYWVDFVWARAGVFLFVFQCQAVGDQDGKPFAGASTYRLTVPANAPVKQYRSATVHDRATHAFTRSLQWSSRPSQTPGLQNNADGSVDSDQSGWTV